MKKQYASTKELAETLEDKLYNRNEVAEAVGCGWANVMEAGKAEIGQKPALVGELVQTGKISTWMYSKAQIIAWRNSVETRTSTSLKCIINLEDVSELAELKALLVGSKFEARI